MTSLDAVFFNELVDQGAADCVACDFLGFELGDVTAEGLDDGGSYSSASSSGHAT
jgi:hypothetical protein